MWSMCRLCASVWHLWNVFQAKIYVDGEYYGRRSAQYVEDAARIHWRIS